MCLTDYVVSGNTCVYAPPPPPSNITTTITISSTVPNAAPTAAVVPNPPNNEPVRITITGAKPTNTGSAPQPTNDSNNTATTDNSFMGNLSNLLAANMTYIVLGAVAFAVICIIIIIYLFFYNPEETEEEQRLKRKKKREAERKKKREEEEEKKKKEDTLWFDFGNDEIFGIKKKKSWLPWAQKKPGQKQRPSTSTGVPLIVTNLPPRNFSYPARGDERFIMPDTVVAGQTVVNDGSQRRVSPETFIDDVPMTEMAATMPQQAGTLLEEAAIVRPDAATLVDEAVMFAQGHHTVEHHLGNTLMNADSQQTL
jgi:hypothetical protein